MRNVVALLLALGVTSFGATRTLRAAEQVPAFRIVVDPKNNVTSVSRELLRDLFLKKATTWPGGEIAHPADLVPDSPTRRAFTKEVLGRSVEDVRAYWLQRIFSGRGVPPPELESDEAALRYVAGHGGGVAYVSGATRLVGVKEVIVR